MANPEHLEILMEGVEAWNQWRNENPKVLPILDVYLASATFAGNDLSQVKGLDKARHRAPSTIGMDTLACGGLPN